MYPPLSPECTSIASDNFRIRSRAKDHLHIIREQRNRIFETYTRITKYKVSCAHTRNACINVCVCTYNDYTYKHEHTEQAMGTHRRVSVPRLAPTAGGYKYIHTHYQTTYANAPNLMWSQLAAGTASVSWVSVA